MAQKVAVVTGSNKGIGYAIVKGLCEKFPGIVYLTARDEGRGKEAISALSKLGFKAEFHQLDVTDKGSIATFKSFLQKEHGGIDVLVNNAAVAFKHNATEPFGLQAEVTIATNYTALLDVCHELFPLLRPHARVVNLSSSAGHLLRIPSKELQKKIHAAETEDQLTELVLSFVEAAKNGTHEAEGWPTSAYSVSKVAVSKLTFIQQADFDKDSREDVIVNAVHPGYVDTDMTSHKGPLTIEEGASAPLYLALLPANVKMPRGAYVWRDSKVVDWTAPLQEPV